jgi:hypothetical protein
VSATPTTPPAPGSRAWDGDQAAERMVRRFVTVLAVTVGGLCFLFSLGNVYQLAEDLDLWVWIRPLVAPAVDLSLVALVVGIRFLARRGVTGRELRRPRLFMLAVGLATWALNTAGAVADRDWGKAAFDSLAPGLLIGWAEVLPWFLRQFQAVTHPPVASDSSKTVPVAPPSPPADNRMVLAATSAPDVPAAPAPAAAAVAVPAVAAAVPLAGGNGYRPRPASPARADERDADASMRAYWAAARTAGRTPTGAELDRVCGRDPRNGAGRKARARYLREEAAGRFHAPQPVPEPGAAVPVPVPDRAADPAGAGPVPAPVPAGPPGRGDR